MRIIEGIDEVPYRHHADNLLTLCYREMPDSLLCHHITGLGRTLPGLYHGQCPAHDLLDRSRQGVQTSRNHFSDDISLGEDSGNLFPVTDKKRFRPRTSPPAGYQKASDFIVVHQFGRVTDRRSSDQGEDRHGHESSDGYRGKFFASQDVPDGDDPDDLFLFGHHQVPHRSFRHEIGSFQNRAVRFNSQERNAHGLFHFCELRRPIERNGFLNDVGFGENARELLVFLYQKASHFFSFHELCSLSKRGVYRDG